MNLLLQTLVIGLACLGSTSIWAQDYYKVQAGPAEVTLEFDRYSGHGSLRLNYTGYLHTCADPSDYEPVKVMLIFHGDQGTEIFERRSYRVCQPSTFLPYNVSTFRTLEFQDPNDTGLWRSLRRARNGETILELAFERRGSWDSDYGNNYPVF